MELLFISALCAIPFTLFYFLFSPTHYWEKAEFIKKGILAYAISLIASLLIFNWIELWQKAPFNQPVTTVYSDKIYFDTVTTTSVDLGGKSKSVTVAMPGFGAQSFNAKSLCLTGRYVAVGASFKIRYRIWWMKDTYRNGKVKYRGYVYLDHPYSCDSQEKRNSYFK